MNPRLELRNSTRKLPPSEGMGNTVSVAFSVVMEEIHEDPATGIQTLIGSDPVDSSPYIINFSIGSTCHSHIRDLLLDRLNNQPLLSESLATRIASAARNLGFGINGFVIDLSVTLIYQRVSVVSSESLLKRMVCEGTIDEEELKNLKMETEPCSICLENLLGSKTGAPTRMPCSHVFHDRCILEWFGRKNTCPMCRSVVSEATEG